MKYFLLSLINTAYGIILLLTTSKDTPGVIFIIFIASTLTILGLSGFILWLLEKITASKNSTLASYLLKRWFKIIKNVDILLVLGILLRVFIVQPFLVDGSSMEPSFQDKEFILVDRLSYYFRQPERGEVIIFHAPQRPTEDYIKRIIAVPGETIKIEKNKIYINGNPLKENYTSEDGQTIIRNSSSDFLTQTLGQDEYFVLGDNRNHSSDSRDWGTVPRKNIVGRTWFIIYPLEDLGIVANPKTDFQKVTTTSTPKLITSPSP